MIEFRGFPRRQKHTDPHVSYSQGQALAAWQKNFDATRYFSPIFTQFFKPQKRTSSRTPLDDVTHAACLADEIDTFAIVQRRFGLGHAAHRADNTSACCRTVCTAAS